MRGDTFCALFFSILCSIIICVMLNIIFNDHNGFVITEYHFGGMISEKIIIEKIDYKHKKIYELYETFTFENKFKTIFKENNVKVNIDSCKIFIDNFPDEKEALNYHSLDNLYDIYKLYSPDSEEYKLGNENFCNILDCNVKIKFDYSGFIICTCMLTLFFIIPSSIVLFIASSHLFSRIYYYYRRDDLTSYERYNYEF